MANTPDADRAEDDFEGSPRSDPGEPSSSMGSASDPATSSTPQPSGRPARRADLIGAWFLESYTLTVDDTEHVDYPLGRQAVGMIIYSPDGYMSAQLIDPQHVHSADPGHDPISAAGLLAYSGSFTVDGTTGFVAHHLLVSSRADWLRTNQHRHSMLNGERLTLSFTAVTSEVSRTSTLTWHRLKAQSPR